jgi:primase-polymerase (primpol)-like protein
VKAFARGHLPAGSRHKVEYEGGEVEVYEAARYFTVTGNVVDGYAAIGDAQAGVDWLAEWILRPADPPPKPDAPARPEARPTRGEDDLLARARASANGHTFARLFDQGDTTGHGGDDSRADLALCGMLAFWAGPDPDRIDRLFRQSSPVRGGGARSSPAGPKVNARSGCTSF